jgi:prophage tail gpP-like protein
VASTHVVEMKLLSTGSKLTNWERYDIVLDMLQPGSPFTFSLFRSDEDWDRVRAEVKAFESVVLSIDKTTLINGVIEHVQPFRGRGKGSGIIIAGTDVTGRLQRIDADPHVSLRATTLQAAIENLLVPLGITSIAVGDPRATAEVQSGIRRGARSIPHLTRQQRIDLVHPRVGEKVFSVIQRMARKVGFWVWVAPDEAGNLCLVIDNPVSGGEPVFEFKYDEQSPHLATGDSSLLESDETINVADMPTEVTAYGRTMRGDAQAARIRAVVQASFNARWVKSDRPRQPRHYRPSHARTQAAITQDATRLIREQAIGHDYVTGTVEGHGYTRQNQDRLHAVNTIVHWKDVNADVDADMVLTRVQFTGGRTEGHETRVRAHPKGVLNLTPEN